MRLSRYFWVVMLLEFVEPRAARGFALLGPFAPWMTAQLSYQDGYAIGGPMALGEGYRWNIPVITYGFDPSFIAYFGTNGVAAVESAIQLLNDLPPASETGVTNYPNDSARINFLAQEYSLYDLKSAALSLLLEQTGLARPTRSVFCLRDFSVVDGGAEYDLLMRNYDPIGVEPSAYIDAVQYQCVINVFTDGGFYRVPYDQLPSSPYFINLFIGPVYFNLYPTSPVAEGEWESNVGEYYLGLDFDTAGGLQYLLGTNTIAWEGLIPGVRGSGTNATNFVNLALRPGVDKITFQRLDFDAVAGRFIEITNQYTDYYLSNNVVQRQALERSIDEPDILFSANYCGWDVVSRSGTTNWINYALPSGDGPGVIQPPVVINFNQLGPSWSHYSADDGYTTNDLSPIFGCWASFDGTTNPPVIYPMNPFTTNGTAFHLLIEPVEPFTTEFMDPALFTTDFTWNLAGKPEAVFLLQTSTNLVDWINATSITNVGGTFTFAERVVPGVPARFYRTVSQ